MLSKSDQERIMLEDAKRHIDRRRREDIELSVDPTSRAALEDWTCERPLLKGLGSVTPPRKYPNREPRSKAHGAAAMPRTAQEAELLASGALEDTVLVTKNGKTEVVTVSELRRKTRKTAPTSTKPRTVDTARFNTGHNFND